MRFQLGMFDPPEMVKYARIPFSENDTPAHHALSLKAARESIVLLKNENNTLPLKKDIKTIAVIGPNADDKEVLLGNYNGQPSVSFTALDGIKNKVSPRPRCFIRRECFRPALSFEPVEDVGVVKWFDAGLKGGIFQ